MRDHKTRVAVFLNSPLSQEDQAAIRDGKAPRHDILTLRDRLGAVLIQPDWRPADSRFSAVGRFWQMWRMGWLAWRRRDEYDIIVVDLDAVGGVLALLLKLSRGKKGHILICHGKIAYGKTGKLAQLLRKPSQRYGQNSHITGMSTGIDAPARL